MTILGLDYGEVDNNKTPDFAKARAAGARFLYLKGSQSLTPDKHYTRDACGARSRGLVVGAYLFPSFHYGAASVKQQVDTFVVATSAAGILHGKDLPPCLDVEFPGNGVIDTGRSQSDVLSLVIDFVAELTSVFGCVPCIYTSHGQMHDTNGLGGPAAPEATACPLWQKVPYRLAARHPLDTVAPILPHRDHDPTDPNDFRRIPLPWRDVGYWICQYQGDCLGFPGFSATVDVNVFHGLDHTCVGDPRISWVQKKLKVPVTGVWDAPTNFSVRTFQASKGLVSDGFVGPATFAALAWLP